MGFIHNGLTPEYQDQRLVEGVRALWPYRNRPDRFDGTTWRVRRLLRETLNDLARHRAETHGRRALVRR